MLPLEMPRSVSRYGSLRTAIRSSAGGSPLSTTCTTTEPEALQKTAVFPETARCAIVVEIDSPAVGSASWKEPFVELPFCCTPNENVAVPPEAPPVVPLPLAVVVGVAEMLANTKNDGNVGVGEGVGVENGPSGVGVGVSVGVAVGVLVGVLVGVAVDRPVGVRVRGW